ncbi:DUF6415 family natural product biosynthesis protein [Streptomyces sp. NPDC012623]|uniref:DUF6415 family natural product biosynthesis protein n=1 Tax=unclassified Streptomyces TaxID=2593676 RepID=UPI0036D166AE
MTTYTPPPTAPIARWLLSAADDARQAQRDWDSGGPALLPLGREFDAVKASADLVHAAVASTAPTDVCAALSALGGPVICDPGVWFYALVPVGTAGAWTGRTGAARGTGAWCAVPRLGSTAPEGRRPYWSVPPDGPGQLCDPEQVAALLQAGQERLETVERLETAHRALLDHLRTCAACSMEKDVRIIADDCETALASHQAQATHTALTDRAELMRRHLAVLMPMAEAQRGEYGSRDRAVVDGALRDAEQLLADAPQEDRVGTWVQLRALARVARVLADAHWPRRTSSDGQMCEAGVALRLTVRRARGAAAGLSPRTAARDGVGCRGARGGRHGGLLPLRPWRPPGGPSR